MDFVALSRRDSQATMIAWQQRGQKDAVFHLDMNQGSLKEQSCLQLSRGDAKRQGCLQRSRVALKSSALCRLAQRWGLTNGRTVEQTEADLKLLWPEVRPMNFFTLGTHVRASAVPCNARGWLGVCSASCVA